MTFDQVNIVNAYKIDRDFKLTNSLFNAVKLTENADPDLSFYPGYGIGFDAHETLSLSNGSGFGKNVIIFGVDNSSSVYAAKKDILILGKNTTEMDSMILQKQLKLNTLFILANNKRNFYLNLHYEESSSFLIFNGVQIYQF